MFVFVTVHSARATSELGPSGDDDIKVLKEAAFDHERAGSLPHTHAETY
jgi:hypothetical protein